MELVFVKDKVFIGKMVAASDSEEMILEEALEVREMMVPTQEGQVQRMVNFATVSPFEQAPLTIKLRGYYGIVKLEEGSNTLKAYERFTEQMRQATGKIQVVPAGAIPNERAAGNKVFGGQFSGKR